MNYVEDTSPIIENTKYYYFYYPPSLPITFGAPCEVINPQKQSTPEIHKSGDYWNKEYESLFGNLTPTLNKTDKNMLTWELPPTQPLTESSTTLSKETAILQPIGKINKEKQPELAPGEHFNM
ncbi:hypothetical protein G9A89_022947 [Geosiphon pyriformis]|nr:hypothetical protein G9A89_022947 [Geosiphon pyriformis]